MLAVVADEGRAGGRREGRTARPRRDRVWRLLLRRQGRQRLGLARPDPHAQPVDLGEGLRDLLEAAVLEQPLDQLLPRVFLGLAGGLRRPREQHLGLDVDQQRGLVDVLAGDVEVQLLHEPEIRVELVADRRHRDVGDLHPVELDQVQQQVERPLEDRQMDLPGLGQCRLRAFALRRGLRRTRRRELQTAGTESAPADPGLGAHPATTFSMTRRLPPIIEPHRRAHAAPWSRRSAPGPCRRSLDQDVVHRVAVAQQLLAAAADRLQVIDQDLGQQLLVVHAADRGGPALAGHPLLDLGGRDQLVELVEVADLGPARDRLRFRRCGSVNICMHFWRITSGVSERLMALP